MVWRKALPSSGGGGLRRLVRLRKDLFNNYRNPITPTSSLHEHTSQYQESEAMQDYRHKFMKPLTLFDFKNVDDAADAKAVDYGSTKGGWRLSDDEVIGGYSRGALKLVGDFNNDDYNDDYNGENTDDDTDDDTDTDSTESENLQQTQQQQQPFIRWAGNIDTTIGPKSRAKRSGFCAIRCPEFPMGVPLGNRYNALEINCRTDGRVYTVNLKVSSYFPDDLYQALITVDETKTSSNNKDKDEDKNEFLTLVLPFADFLLTSGGLVRENQRSLDGGIHMEHLGFTIMDGKDGPFEFDLARIRAINYHEGVIVGDE